MPKNYLVTDRRTTQQIAVLPGVLDPKALTGVETTSGSNVITVASTTGVFPGMLVSCQGVPFGAEVKSVPSATTLELQLSVWTGSTTQEFSRSTANAQATATATGLLATAHGYNPVSRVCFVPKGTWRNIFRAPGYIASAGGTVAFANSLWTMYTTYEKVVGTPNTFPTDKILTRYSDELMETPALRQRMEPVGTLVFIGALGHEMTVPYDPQNLIISVEEEA